MDKLIKRLATGVCLTALAATLSGCSVVAGACIHKISRDMNSPRYKTVQEDTTYPANSSEVDAKTSSSYSGN